MTSKKDDTKKKEPFTVTTQLNLPNMLNAKKESIKKVRRNKGNIIDKKFSNIETVFAKNGVVNIVLQDGTKTTMTPIQAFAKCKGIHEMGMRMNKSAKLAEVNAPMSKRAQNIREEAAITMHKVQKFLTVAREAHRQLETGDANAVGLFNLLHGRDYYTGEATHVKDNVGAQMDFYKTQCFSLSEDEIYTILTVDPDKFTMDERDKILVGEHSNRMREFHAQNINNFDDLPTFKV